MILYNLCNDKLANYRPGNDEYWVEDREAHYGVLGWGRHGEIPQVLVVPRGGCMQISYVAQQASNLSL